MTDRGLTTRTARWSATHPWQAIIGWLVFVVVCLAAGAAVGTRSATNDDYRIGEAGRAEAILAEGGLSERAVENILITGRDGRMDPAAAKAAVDDITQRMRTLPEVADVAAPITAPGGTALRVPVTMTTQGAAQDAVSALTAQTEAVAREHPTLRIEESGDRSISLQIDEENGAQTRFAEMVSLPITLLVLLSAFGALIAASVPLLVAISSVVAATVSTQFFPSVGQNNTLFPPVNGLTGSR